MTMPTEKKVGPHPVDDLYTAYYAVQRALSEAAASAPRLVAEAVDDDGEHYVVLKCPRCGENVQPDELKAVSPGEDWAELRDDALDLDENDVLTFRGASGDGDWGDTLFIMHDGPGWERHIVAPPEDFHIDYL